MNLSNMKKRGVVFLIVFCYIALAQFLFTAFRFLNFRRLKEALIATYSLKNCIFLFGLVSFSSGFASIRKIMDLLEWVQRRAVRMTRGWRTSALKTGWENILYLTMRP